MAYYEKETDSWRADVSIGGSRTKKRGFLSRQLAEAWEMQAKLNHQRGLLAFETVDVAEILPAMNAYLAHSKKYKTRKSARRDESALAHWMEFFDFKRISLFSDMKGKGNFLDEYVSWRGAQETPRRRKPSNRTMNLEMATLRVFVSWCREKGIVRNNPIPQKLPLFRQPKPDFPRCLSLEEIRIIEKSAGRLSAKDPRLSSFFPAFSFLVRTGIRADELCGLETADFDLPAGRMVLRADRTKAKRPRLIPLNEIALLIASIMIDEAEMAGRKQVFATSSGKPQTTDNLNRRFRSVLNNLERRGDLRETRTVSIHTLRRTYISHMIMSGADPATVMEIVGHRDWATMKRYLALSPDHISTAARALPY